MHNIIRASALSTGGNLQLYKCVVRNGISEYCQLGHNHKFVSRQQSPIPILWFVFPSLLILKEDREIALSFTTPRFVDFESQMFRFFAITMIKRGS